MTLLIIIGVLIIAALMFVRQPITDEPDAVYYDPDETLPDPPEPWGIDDYQPRGGVDEKLNSRGLLIRLLGFRENGFRVGDLVTTPDGWIGAIAEFDLKSTVGAVWIRVIETDGWEEWFNLRDCEHAS